MIEERLSYALLVGAAVDGILGTPPRSPLGVQMLGLGTPPIPFDGVWARAYSGDGFVVVADAGAVAVDHPELGAPPPKHLAGKFDLHFTLSASGYDDLPVTVNCNHDALPIKPAAYKLAPHPFAVHGRVTTGGFSPVPLAGATVSVTATVPPLVLPAVLPPPVVTDANGTYAFPAVPAATTITVTVAGHAPSATVLTNYPEPTLTVNFAF